MEKQITSNEQTTKGLGALTAFGIPQVIYMDGVNITAEVVEKFGGVEKWLRRLVVAFGDLRVTAFAIARINGVVKLYVKSIY